MINNHNIKCLLVILSCINNYTLIILKSFSWYFHIKFCRQKYHYYLSCSYSFNYVINNSVIPRIFHGRIEITVKNYGNVMNGVSIFQEMAKIGGFSGIWPFGKYVVSLQPILWTRCVVLLRLRHWRRILERCYQGTPKHHGETYPVG